MPAEALAFALAAAVIHASWNVLLAGARDVEAATAVALPVSALAVAPVAAVWWDLHASAWPFVAACPLVAVGASGKFASRTWFSFSHWRYGYRAASCSLISSSATIRP